MPVRDHPVSSSVSPFSRLSYTGLDMYRRCPRMFWYRYQMKIMEPQHPRLYIGKIVESSLCRVLTESPSLVSPSDSHDVFFSPKMYIEPKYQGQTLDPIWRPSVNQNDVWPGPEKGVRPTNDWPSTLIQLENWAKKRAEVHLPFEFEKYVNEWKKNPNKVGDLKYFESRKDSIRDMINAGIKFHLEEVRDCIDKGGGPLLSKFRIGDWRPEWPAPDGFPYDYTTPHPCAKIEGEISCCEAWEVARPWFVDPVASDFAMTSVHPEGWLSGEYDLIYRWTGEIRIFDIKASKGNSSFSEGYPRQAAIYAYLWWVTHNKEQKVSNQEIWYLGVPVRKELPIPSDEELVLLEKELREMYLKLYANRSSDELDFPTKPSPVSLFEPGGILSHQNHLSPENRCKDCSYTSYCPGSPFNEKLESTGKEFTPISEIDPRIDIRGTVSSEPMLVSQYPNYTEERLQFTLEVPGFISPLMVLVKKENYVMQDWLVEGAVVRLCDAIPSTWICQQPGFVWHLRADIGESGDIELANKTKPTDATPSQLRIKLWNVKGKIVSFNHREDEERRIYNMMGVGYDKWSSAIYDSSGVIQFQIFSGKKGSQTPFRMILDLGQNHSEWQIGQEVTIRGAVAVERNGVISLEGRRITPKHPNDPRTGFMTRFLPVGWEQRKPPKGFSEFLDKMKENKS